MYGISASADDTEDGRLERLRAELVNAPDDAQLRLEVARALVTAGKLQEAITVLEPTPPSLEAVLLRAKALLWSGSPERAQQVLGEAPEAIQRAIDARIVSSEALEALGALTSAKETIEAVLRELPDHPAALAIQARLAERLAEAAATSPLERIAAAAEARAAARDPERQLEAEATLIHELEGVPTEERQAALSALEDRWPEDARRERLLLGVLQKWQDFPAAFQRAQNALRLDPAADDLRKGLGDLACGAAWTLLGNKDPKAARAVALSMNPPDARPNCLLLAQGHSSMALTDFVAAGLAFDALRERDPKNKDALLGSAQAALARGDFQKVDRSVDALETLPDVDRKQTTALRVDRCVRSAHAALQRYQPAEGERWARRALKLDPASIEGTLLLASALQNQRRDPEAREVLSAGIVHNPRSPRLLSALARIPGEHDHAAVAQRAIALLDQEPAETKFDVQLGLGDALVLDGRLDEAAREFGRSMREQPSSQAPQLRLAQVSMRQGDFFLAHEQIRLALEQSRSFGALLSLADASHALNLEADAFRLTRAALEVQPGQPDAQGLLDRLEFAHAPVAGARLMHSWDNGMNRAWEYGASSSTDLHPDLRANADASMRNVENLGTGESASVVGLRLGLAHQWTSRVAVSGAVGLVQFKSDYADESLSPWALARTDLRIGPSHRLGLEYQADTFSYTAGMVDDHLGLHSLSAISYGPVIPWVSYYTNASLAKLTDGNGRGLVFASLYSDLVNQPVVKTGLNGQILGFSETSLRSYFSPSQLLNTEVFAEIFSDNIDNKLIYGALAAGGLQWIEDREQQTTYRFNARFGVRPWRSLKVVALGQTSSSATTNIAGFDYYELGVTSQVTFY